MGTVNMDESTHGFSRKVLDRAFTIELSDIDLSVWERVVNGPTGITLCRLKPGTPCGASGGPR